MMSNANSKVSPLHHENLETLSLVWLDTHINTTEDNQRTQRALRQIINHLRTFDDPQQCYHYIKSRSAQDRLILIVSGQLGRQIVPQIHNLRQVSSIYVFCRDKQINEQWTRQCPKIRNVIVTTADLLDQVREAQRGRIKFEEPLPIKIYNCNNNPDQSTTGLNGHCVHSLLLIDVLLRMKSNENDKQELIKLCQNLYANNDVQLALVNEFEREYTPNRALWWYTRESFIYQMLNKALRIQNIELLYLFRFFIQDIYQQLRQNQCQSSVHVYRGQVISTDELKVLHQSMGKFISINSFFSTSMHRNTALEFLENSNISNDLHRVLFIVDANPSMVKSKPFADISSSSDVTDESEVLFMTGCMFRLMRIEQNKDNIWTIEMKLYDDDQHDLKSLFTHMKEEYGCGENEVTLQSFGDVLHRMGKYDLAEKMYNRLLGKLSSNDPSLFYLYYAFGIISKDRNEYDISLQWFSRALEMEMDMHLPDDIRVAGVYCCIGNVQMQKGNYPEAIQYYNKAFQLYSQGNAANHQQLKAAVCHGMGDTYLYQKNYSDALTSYTQSLSLQEQYLPADHSDIAINLDRIGIVYCDLNWYDVAMSYHNRSLQIRQKSLPPQHPDIAKSFKYIGLLYETLKEWNLALCAYGKAASIYRHTLSAEHPDAVKLQKDIERVFLYIT